MGLKEATEYAQVSVLSIFVLRHQYGQQAEVLVCPEAVFLVICDPSMNKLWVTKAHRDLCIDLSRSLTACS
jgi:hypothetical protein